MTLSITTCFAFFSPGPMEMVIIGVVAVLLFGKRLPEVGRSLGRGIVEFKKGVRGVEEEIETATSRSHHSYDEERDEPSAPRFDPPPEDDAAADDAAADEAEAAERVRNYS